MGLDDAATLVLSLALLIILMELAGKTEIDYIYWTKTILHLILEYIELLVAFK